MTKNQMMTLQRRSTVFIFKIRWNLVFEIHDLITDWASDEDELKLILLQYSTIFFMMVFLCNLRRVVFCIKITLKNRPLHDFLALGV
jgi:hypothetical protein